MLHNLQINDELATKWQGIQTKVGNKHTRGAYVGRQQKDRQKIKWHKMKT